MRAHVANSALHLLFLIHFSTCRDFYLGMFKKNDLLMSQDTLYKERVPYRFTYAKYGRKYNCPITYVRVLDRLNIGRGPRVEIIRGGLRNKYIVLRLTSPYNNPLSVNIFVGCENKKFTNPPWKIIRPTKKPIKTSEAKTTEKGNAKTATVKTIATTKAEPEKEEDNKIDADIENDDQENTTQIDEGQNDSQENKDGKTENQEKETTSVTLVSQEKVTLSNKLL